MPDEKLSTRDDSRPRAGSRRPLTALAALLLLVCGGGARCIPTRTAAAPHVLPETASLAQIVETVNGNTARVASYATHDARITVAGMPSLRADIVAERPRRFRLRAETALSGAEVDLGSNDEQFWFWLRRGEPPALYHCRHGACPPGSAGMPIEPAWLIEALGLVTFEPSDQHSGPTPLRGGRMEVRSRLVRPEGTLTRIVVVDGARGWVLEQHLYGADGRLLASARADRHRYDPESGVSLPRQVAVQLPAAQLSLQIDSGNFQINAPGGASGEVWVRPVYDGYPAIDLASGPPTSPVAGPTAAVPTATPWPRPPLR